MMGAVIGDIAGSIYELTENNVKTKDFPLFGEGASFTDDTVMTVAVAEALMNGFGDPDMTRAELIRSFHMFGSLYPDAGYGYRFSKWLDSGDTKPYNSFGNGSAMRVSPVAWIYDDLETVERYAGISASVTHDHPEGIKGAQAVAAAIFIARKGGAKKDIRQYVGRKYGYCMDLTCDNIRMSYHREESCQHTVPEAMSAFFEGKDFEDVIRNAISLGGDSDTLAAISGSIAEGMYMIPHEMKEKALSYLDGRLISVLERFDRFIKTGGLHHDEI